MGGVDLLDRMIGYYRISARTRKWTIRLIFHLFDFALAAAWLEYRRQQTQLKTSKKDRLDSFEFRQRIAEKLIYGTTLPRVAIYEEVDNTESDDEQQIRKKRKNALPHPPQELRTSMALHMPTIPEQGKNYRCRMTGCKSNKARVQCSTCKMHLCLTFDRNCFKLYHESQNL